MPDSEQEDVQMDDAHVESDRHDGEKQDENDDNHDMLQTIHNLSTFLCSVEEDGEELAAGFQRIPNRRALPDYFDVISEPIAFSTIRGKTQKKQYVSFQEFVRDVAQICHNAQVYNRPSAPIFQAAVRLREIFKAELQKLATQGDISPEDAELPDLGELPPVEDTSPRDSEDREEEDNDDEDDEDELDDGEESDDDGAIRRQSARKRSRKVDPLDGDYGDENHKRPGRPPVILTPVEARIASIIRGVRKPKDEDGNLLIIPFEKLPDKLVVPDYYQVITSPIALDSIKKKAKRKKYSNVDQLMEDIQLMFENAKQYNEDGSDVYRAAVQLLEQARQLARQEKDRDDDDFRDEDGKLALADIQHNGQIWRVGDWVHIRNPNDLAKPIVAQIFRTWQDRAGQKWINACWYYRPEQTVHRFEKHFFEREVFKTGQYRDHQIGDVLDRCFVMFVTRFNKGRPRDFPSDKEVYVCESRYNEDSFRFNKIKTWASCLPDEVRERDYEMDLYGAPRPMRKFPSPIKHLLREDAKETDGPPKVTWGSPNAPPIVGAVHCQPLGPNDSPPPQAPSSHAATPFAAGVLAESTRQQSISLPSRDTTAQVPHSTGAGAPPGMSPSFVAGQYNNHNVAHHQNGASMNTVTPVHQTPVPIPQPPQHFHAGTALQGSSRPPQFQQHHGYSHNSGANFPQSPSHPVHHSVMNHHMAVNYGNTNTPPNTRLPIPPQGATMALGNAYNPPRPPEVYTLPENLDGAVPTEIHQAFRHDDAGRILFFTAPPLGRQYQGWSSASTGFGHSVEYLAGRDEWLAERKRKRAEREHTESNYQTTQRQRSKMNAHEDVSERTTNALNKWFLHLDNETHRWAQMTGLENWGKVQDLGLVETQEHEVHQGQV